MKKGKETHTTNSDEVMLMGDCTARWGSFAGVCPLRAKIRRVIPQSSSSIILQSSTAIQNNDGVDLVHSTSSSGTLHLIV